MTLGGSEQKDQGFSLIELLVVIIIIGMLAGIAIPVFINQRVKGYDTTARSDLRNLAQFQEGYLAGGTRYALISDIVAAGDGVRVSDDITLSVLLYDGSRGFCLSAKHAGSPTTWFWDSLAGGLQPKGAAACPSVTSGTVGDTVSG